MRNKLLFTLLSFMALNTIHGSLIIDGEGNELELTDSGNLEVIAGSKLTLKNLILTGLQDERLIMKDGTSKLVLNDAKIVLSGAYKEAQGIKGEADAKSTKIYADAYSKDSEFYSFLKTLETYKNTVDKDSTLILTTEGDYFKYLKQISPNK